MDRRFEAAAKAAEHRRVWPGVGERVIGRGSAGSPERRRDNRKRLHVFGPPADVAMDLWDAGRETARQLVLEPRDVPVVVRGLRIRIDQVSPSAEQRVVFRGLLSDG